MRGAGEAGVSDQLRPESPVSEYHALVAEVFQRPTKKAACKPPFSVLVSGPSGHAVEIGDDLAGMIRRRHFVICHGDFAVRSDQHRFARRSCAVRFGHAEGGGNGAFLVAEQVVGEREFIAKRAVVRRAVITDADD